MRKLVSYLLACVVGVLQFFGFRPREERHASPHIATAPIKGGIALSSIPSVPKQKPVISDRLNPYDDLEEWGHDWTFKPPMAKHEVDDFQRKIDNVFGTNRDGKSCFKLVWNGDQRYWWKYAYDWNSFGDGIKWELRPRILWKKVDLGNGDYVDLFPPRWLLLGRIEPEQYAETWKEESWIFDPARGPMIRETKCANCRSVLDFTLVRCEACGLDIDMATTYRHEGGRKQIREDAPPSVFWDTLEVIGDHDAFCCEAFEGECFGTFRNPGDKELDMLRQRRREFEKRGQSPYEMLSKGTEAKIASFCRDYYRKQYEKMPASVDLVIEHADEYLKPLMQFTGNNLSVREQREIVKGALDRHYTEKAEQFEQKIRGN